MRAHACLVASLVASSLMSGQAAQARSGSTVALSRLESALPAGAPSRHPDISADGRWVVFESDADLTSDGDDNGDADIFVADRDPDGDGVLDENPALPPTMIRITPPDADGASRNPVMSDDGRWVAFESDAANLCADPRECELMDGSHTDVFLHDRAYPYPARPQRYDVATHTYVVSAGVTELIPGIFFGQPSDGASHSPAIAAEPPFVGDSPPVVAFTSSATNLARSLDLNGRDDVFVMYQPNAFSEGFGVWGNGSIIASVDSNGLPSDGASYQPTVSHDGALVSFASDATNLDAAAGFPPGCPWFTTGQGAARIDRFGQHHPDPLDDRCPNVYIRDLWRFTTKLGSRTVFGGYANGASMQPAFGGFSDALAFVSEATDLLGPLSTPADTEWRPTEVYLTDGGAIANGLANVQLQLVSADQFGSPGFADSYEPSVSAAGTVVAFTSKAVDLTSYTNHRPGTYSPANLPAVYVGEDEDTNNAPDIYLRDLDGRYTERVSLGSANQQSNLNEGSFGAVLSANAEHVAFWSDSTNFWFPKPDPDDPGIYVRNRTSCVAGRRPDGPISMPVNGNERPEVPGFARSHLETLADQIDVLLDQANFAVAIYARQAIDIAFYETSPTALRARLVGVHDEIIPLAPEPVRAALEQAFADVDALLASDYALIHSGGYEAAKDANTAAYRAAEPVLNQAGDEVPPAGSLVASGSSRPGSLIHEANCAGVVPLEDGEAPVVPVTVGSPPA